MHLLLRTLWVTVLRAHLAGNVTRGHAGAQTRIMPLHHPAAYRLAADFDRLANDPHAVAARANSIAFALDAVERDHPADSECVAYPFRTKLALNRLRASLMAGYPFVAAFDLQQREVYMERLESQIDEGACGLLRVGGDTTAVDDSWLEELPPLVRASARGDDQAVETLLAAGSDPNEADGDGW